MVKSKKNKVVKALSASSALKITRDDIHTDEHPPEPKATLHDTIKASYGDQNGIEALTNAGYVKDAILSNHNQSVFYNPRSNQLLYDIAGTHNVRDALTDVNLFFGNLKGTDRYREARDIYKKAKQKYNVSGENISVVGHSLGGSLASAITEKERGVHVTTYNKGVGLGGLLGTERNHAGEKAYRNPGDVISLLGSGKRGSTNTGRFDANPLEAHSSDNLRNANVYV